MSFVHYFVPTSSGARSILQIIAHSKTAVPLCMGFLALSAVTHSALAQDYKCENNHLTKSVTEAGQTIEKLNAENKAKFQQKLRLLKQKKGWNDQEFIQKASAYIRNEQIAAFDRESKVHVTSISNLRDATGKNTQSEDCVMLVGLKGHLSEMIEITQRKWDFMFHQVDKDLKAAE